MTEPEKEPSPLRVVPPWFKKDTTPDGARRWGWWCRGLMLGCLVVGAVFLWAERPLPGAILIGLAILASLEARSFFSWAEGVELGRKRERKALGLDD